jgi:hypothetical protein
MRSRADDEMVGLRLMTEMRVGDEVVYEGRTFRVRGISPMSASPRRVMLEELGIEAAALLEVRADEVEPSARAEAEST